MLSTKSLVGCWLTRRAIDVHFAQVYCGVPELPPALRVVLGVVAMPPVHQQPDRPYVVNHDVSRSDAPLECQQPYVVVCAVRGLRHCRRVRQVDKWVFMLPRVALRAVG